MRLPLYTPGRDVGALNSRVCRVSFFVIIFCSSSRRFASAFVPGRHRYQFNIASPTNLQRSSASFSDWTVSNYSKLMASSAGVRAHGSTSPKASGAKAALEKRIYEFARREFEIGKPAVLAKVLFDEVQIFDPNGPNLAVSRSPSKARARSLRKAKSVSVSSLTAAVEAEADPVKRELVTLVLQWLDAKAVARRGGFKASGEKVADRPDWASQIIPDHDGLKADPSAPPVLLIDGHNIVFRSFHALPQLTAPDGTPVGAVVGFCNVMNKMVLQPWADGSEPRRRVIVAFDSGEDNFRHTLYPGYKADRPEAPEELRQQFALIRQACMAYGFEVAEGLGFEADDVIATLALQAVTSGATNVTIVSSDKDLGQLVTRRVGMFNCYSGERLGPDEVLEKHLAPPGRLADLLAIAGDKADGVRGAEGYGPVNAAKVLAKHATLEEAVAEICETMSKKKKDPAVIEDTREQIFLARSVVELRTDVPVDIGGSVEAPAFRLGGGQGAGPILDFWRQLGMQDLIRKTFRTLGGADEKLTL